MILELLALLGLNRPSVEGSIGIGLDSCVIPTRHSGVSLVQTTDLYPLQTPWPHLALTFNPSPNL